jgi:hypothetical protein
MQNYILISSPVNSTVFVVVLCAWCWVSHTSVNMFVVIILVPELLDRSCGVKIMIICLTHQLSIEFLHLARQTNTLWWDSTCTGILDSQGLLKLVTLRFLFTTPYGTVS